LANHSTINVRGMHLTRVSRDKITV